MVVVLLVELVDTVAGTTAVSLLLVVGLTGASAEAEDVLMVELDGVTVVVTVAVVVKPEVLTDTTVTTDGDCEVDEVLVELVDVEVVVLELGVTV